MIITFGILSLLLGFGGFRNAFYKRKLVIFIWIIVIYYGITSLLALFSQQNELISQTVKNTYMANYLFCTLGFYLSDYLFDKNRSPIISFEKFQNTSLLKCIEIVYWVSFILTFIELRNQDYNTYNTGNGAGWAQVLFMLTSGINFYFAQRRKWIKVALSFVLILLIIEVLEVRSFLYFVLMPIGFYYLYYMLHNVHNLRKFLLRCIPFGIIVLITAFIVSYIRFGECSLPETELTDIALDSMTNWNFGDQYINSFLHYIHGFFIPINNALKIVGLSIPDFTIIPSVPRLNAMMRAGVSDVSMLENAYHMPGTLFYDFYVSWGNYAGIIAFLVYWYLLKIFELFQKGAFRIILFSSLVGWHFYMLMRGAVDTCSSAMGYPLLLGLLVFFLIKKMNLLRGDQSMNVY